MIAAPVLAVDAANRWLLAFSIAALVVLGVGVIIRGEARRSRLGERGTHVSRRKGYRRRAGAVLALGPLIGLACAPTFGDFAVVIALGGLALALVGIVTERSPHAQRLGLLATVVAAGVAVAAGATFGPTGVDGLDRISAFVLIAVVVQAIDGLGNFDGITPGIGAPAAMGLFALAAFAHQDGLAAVLAGFTAACIAFLAFNLHPASLFVGRAGRLTTGYVLAVGALAVDPAPGAWRGVATPLIILGVVLLDGAVVIVSRLRRRRPLTEHRSDHIVHRLGRLGWNPSEAVWLMVAAQLALATIAVFTGRGVMVEWLGVALAALVLLVLGIEAGRAALEREPAPGLTRRAWIVVGIVIVALVAAVLPTALVAGGAADLMLQGKDAASRGLVAARAGDTITAQGAFNEAARTFGRARDRLDSTMLSPGLGVPGVASNLRAARTLAEVGTDLASAGESIAVAANPEALRVVDGRLPLDEVKKIRPQLERGATVLTRALQRIDPLVHDPYLAPPVHDAIDKVRGQLVQAEREARHAAAAAKLAPALFGGNGPRTYLLVVQNNAESRATGGFIGDYGLITAVDGKLHVSDLTRIREWNGALRALADPKLDAPADYVRRYAQYSPTTTLQNINLSPDFPSVARALMSLAPQAGAAAGLSKVDGVMAVDPEGLAALLELTGSVQVPGWPTDVDSNNVVDVALRDEYALFPEDTASRVDLLGDVAKAAVDRATTGELGKPAKIARVLGVAAHAGHLSLTFARPKEQRLAEQLGVTQRMAPVHSDAFAVTTSNVGGNKLDYYLKRDVDYRVTLQPDASATSANAQADVAVRLDNTAPDSGLPQIVIGPFDPRFVAGQNRTFISLYSPLRFERAALDGNDIQVSPGRERGRNVYSVIEDVFSKSSKTTTARLGGTVALHDGWYDLEVRQQPTINPDRLHVSVDVPEGWTIDKAPHMERPFNRRASATLDLTKTQRFRVHVVRTVGTWDLWSRLQAGR